MTTEQKLKIQALYIVVVQAVKKPALNTQRCLRNLLEHAARLFPGLSFPLQKWEALFEKLVSMVQNGDDTAAKQLLAQALLEEGNGPAKNALPPAGPAPEGPAPDEEG